MVIGPPSVLALAIEIYKDVLWWMEIFRSEWERGCALTHNILSSTTDDFRLCDIEYMKKKKTMRIA